MVIDIYVERWRRALIVAEQERYLPGGLMEIDSIYRSIYLTDDV